jgi:hypothetical protein
MFRFRGSRKKRALSLASAELDPLDEGGIDLKILASRQHHESRYVYILSLETLWLW